MINRLCLFLAVLVAFRAHCPSLTHAAVITYGDVDTLGFDSYSSDPTAGATLEGLSPDVVTFGVQAVFHGFPFAPEADDYPGTD